MAEFAMYARAFATKILAPSATDYRELVLISDQILHSSVPGVVVECGCYRGGSTAVLSVASHKARRKLHAFDSFCGLPAPSAEDASHTVLSDSEIHYYAGGAFAGSLDIVKANVSRFGAIGSCEFWPGYFEDTLPRFKEQVAVAFCDVDLISSLKTCIQYLWPLMPDGGVLFTHEAHHLEVAKLFHDDSWWNSVLQITAPGLVGSGSGVGLRKTRHGYYGSCLGFVRKNPPVTRVSNEGVSAETMRTTAHVDCTSNDKVRPG